MKLNLMIGLMLVLPTCAFVGCGSNDDTSSDTAGSGGTGASSAGHGGKGGSVNGSDAGEGGLPAYAGEGGMGGMGGAGAPGAGGEIGEGGSAGAVAALDDAQILKVLSTANDGEVMAAQVAKPSLQNSAAVSFAQMMIDGHTAANGQTLALVSKKHLALEASDVSQALEADTAALLSELSETPTAAFDKTYIDSEVTMHQKVLDLIDSRLTPDASDADLKALLGTLRTSVAAHLASAQTISATLH